MMPIFYVEQKYLSSGKASVLIKLALVADEVGQFIGIVLMLIGLVMILCLCNHRQLNRFQKVPTSER
jgi:hypothetical protein